MKLVRDCIPQIIEEDGRECKWRRVIGRDEHIAKLSAKMREEVWEFTENPSYEEAADMLEVVKAFCYLHNLEWDAVKAYAQNKQESHGGFHNGIILESFDRKS
jgi:predicted house-cleaning noncanonical NTP pyrophosphatase (MazG superfamily)